MLSSLSSSARNPLASPNLKKKEGRERRRRKTKELDITWEHKPLYTAHMVSHVASRAPAAAGRYHLGSLKAKTSNY